MADRCESVLYVVILAELSEGLIVELSAIVRYECVGQPVPTDDRFSEEVLHLLFGYVCQGLSLHPFGEVVNSDEKEIVLPCCRGKRTQDIHSPLGKWPWRGQLAEQI